MYMWPPLTIRLDFAVLPPNPAAGTRARASYCLSTRWTRTSGSCGTGGARNCSGTLLLQCTATVYCLVLPWCTVGLYCRVLLHCTSWACAAALRWSTGCDVCASVQACCMHHLKGCCSSPFLITSHQLLVNLILIPRLASTSRAHRRRWAAVKAMQAMMALHRRSVFSNQVC